jgi:hypothetical protein
LVVRAGGGLGGAGGGVPAEDHWAGGRLAEERKEGEMAAHAAASKVGVPLVVRAGIGVEEG